MFVVKNIFNLVLNSRIFLSERKFGNCKVFKIIIVRLFISEFIDVYYLDWNNFFKEKGGRNKDCLINIFVVASSILEEIFL